MTEFAGDASLRSRVAARTPAFIRKAVRMAEHYGRRNIQWTQVLRDMRGASARDSAMLWLSAALAPFTSMRRLDGFEPPLLVSDVDVIVHGAGAFHLRKGTDDILAVMPSREPHVRRIVEGHLKPGDTFIDAGANHGLFCVMAHRMIGSEGRIIAIEMMPETAAILRSDLARNGLKTTVVVEAALADESGIEVAAVAPQHKPGQASIARFDRPPGSSTLVVKTVRLDQLLADVSHIHLIKMDLEGAEYLALMGATGVLNRVDAIVFENNCGDARIADLLTASGFTVSLLSGHDYFASRISESVAEASNHGCGGSGGKHAGRQFSSND